MNVEVAPQRFPGAFGPRLIDLASGNSRVIAVLDGTGSWEAGAEEASAVADFLQTTWSGNIPSSPEEVVRDLSAGTADLTRLPVDESFGRAGFSFTGLLVRDHDVFVVSCGVYAVVRVHDAHVEMIYRPQFWVDEQVQSGTLTTEKAASHPLRHVYSGRLVSRAEIVCEQTGPIQTGRIVLAPAELIRHLLRNPVASWFHFSATQLQNADHDPATRLRPVVVVNLDAA